MNEKELIELIEKAAKPKPNFVVDLFFIFCRLIIFFITLVVIIAVVGSFR